MNMTDPAEIAARLSETQRDIALALLGNAWEGEILTPGIRLLNDLELMHIDALKGIRFKARPTPLGLAVRDILMKEQK